VEVKGALVAAWFGGSGEGAHDVEIWSSRHDATGWSAPKRIATGVDSNGTRYPCWNPVLFLPKKGPLMCFYKVGHSPQTWWGMLCTSTDGGKTWSEGRRLPDGILGPIKNKPVQLANGDILCPSSSESSDSGTNWRVHFERTSDNGRSWTKTEDLNDGHALSAIQPSILQAGGNELLAIGRTRQGRLFKIASEDLGKSWGKMTLTDVPNPNSGIDAVTMRDGRHCLVFNDTPHGRSPLNVAVSRDGENWQTALALEQAPGEYSYPAIIQSSDGLLHITYTWNRQKVKHVVIDPKKLPSAKSFGIG